MQDRYGGDEVVMEECTEERRRYEHDDMYRLCESKGLAPSGESMSSA